MSGSSAFVFPDADVVDIRRYCGYPAYGSGPGDDTFNRFFAAFETLEYRIYNLTTTEGAVVQARLAELRTLETAIPGAGTTLNVDTAAAFKRNAAEVSERRDLYVAWRLELCGFMGIPPGPFLARSGGGLRSVALVV